MRVRTLAATLVLSLCLADQAQAKTPLWRRCEKAVPWRHAAEVPNSESRLLELAGKGGLGRYSAAWIRAAIARAPKLAQLLAEAGSEKKLLLWYVPSVEGQHMILPHFLDRYMSIAVFSDPDVSTLIQRRYLPLKLPIGGALGKQTKLAAPDFVEPGLLIVDPKGRIVFLMNRINCFNADYFLEILKTVAAEHRSESALDTRYQESLAAFKDKPGPETLLAYAREAMAVGEDGLARAALEGSKEATGAAHLYLRAMLERRARRGPEAIALLDEAMKTAPKDLLGEIGVERGRVLVKTGAFAAAAEVLSAAIARRPKPARAAEGAYWLGVARSFGPKQNKAEAIRAWRSAARLEKNSLWAARSDGYVGLGSDGRQGEGPLMRSMEDPRWLAPEVYKKAKDSQWRRRSEDREDIARRAVDFLLLQQREDGSWPGSRWGGKGSLSAAGENIRMATAAVCCDALRAQEQQDPKRIAAALVLGEKALLERGRVDRTAGSIWIYADGLRLLYFSRRFSELKGPKKRAVKARMKVWLKGLLGHQRANGGAFKHYSYASSFATAAGMHWLSSARMAGLKVPKAALAAGAKVLETMRGPEGFFGYLRQQPTIGRDALGAASRQPLCELALRYAGRGSAAALKASVERYRSAYRSSAEPSRKTNFHNPSLGLTAGYYFFHNFFYACEAARVGGDAKSREALLVLLCELPEIDGAFIDAGFSYGKSYSTAMALLSLEALTRKP